jgi:hypothetical protein
VRLTVYVLYNDCQSVYVQYTHGGGCTVRTNGIAVAYNVQRAII